VPERAIAGAGAMRAGVSTKFEAGAALTGGWYVLTAGVWRTGFDAGVRLTGAGVDCECVTGGDVWGGLVCGGDVWGGLVGGG
jgi:hypothetical protein